MFLNKHYRVILAWYLFFSGIPAEGQWIKHLNTKMHFQVLTYPNTQLEVAETQARSGYQISAPIQLSNCRRAKSRSIFWGTFSSDCVPRVCGRLQPPSIVHHCNSYLDVVGYSSHRKSNSRSQHPAIAYCSSCAIVDCVWDIWCSYQLS